MIPKNKFIEKYGFDSFFEDLLHDFIKRNYEIFFEIYLENEDLFTTVSDALKNIYKDSDFSDKSFKDTAWWMLFSPNYISNGSLYNISIKDHLENLNNPVF